MMIILSLEKIENLIFSNQEIHNLLPEFHDCFTQWKLGIRHGLTLLKDKSVLYLLSSLKQEHLDKLSGYWKDTVAIRKPETDIVFNDTVKLNDLYKYLNSRTDFVDNVTISREKDHVYLSIWR